MTLIVMIKYDFLNFYYMKFYDFFIRINLKVASPSCPVFIDNIKGNT
jgi:hypothetical protein